MERIRIFGAQQKFSGVVVSSGVLVFRSLVCNRPRCATGNGRRSRPGGAMARMRRKSQCGQGRGFWCAFLATLARHWYTEMCFPMKFATVFEHAVRHRKVDVPVWLCEIWSTRGSARCAFWATFGPRFRPRDEARAGVAMRNSASRRCVATSFLRRPKSDVTVLLCEICHTRGWGSKTRAAVALVEAREITKNRGYDY